MSDEPKERPALKVPPFEPTLAEWLLAQGTGGTHIIRGNTVSFLRVEIEPAGTPRGGR